MGLRIGNVTIDDSVGGLKIGNEEVGGLKVGTEIVWEKAAPLRQHTQSINLPGTHYEAIGHRGWFDTQNRVQLDTQFGGAYFASVFLDTSRGTRRFSLALASSASGSVAGSGRAGANFLAKGSVLLTLSTGQSISVDMADSFAPGGGGTYHWSITTTAQIAAWNAIWNALTTPNESATVTFSVPAPPEESATFDVAAVTLSATAAGVISGLGAQFTLGGKTYNVTGCFTHSNGLQMRFATLAEALAFIAAGFEVDSGISGQATFSSSVMQNNSVLNDRGVYVAEYRAFPGRFVNGTTYTVTVTTTS